MRWRGVRRDAGAGPQPRDGAGAAHRVIPATGAGAGSTAARRAAPGAARGALGALLATLALPGCAPTPPAPPERVIVVVVDTLRADRLGIFGRQPDPMPVFAEAAERGVVFERAWAPSSWTAPSTASLFTGVYPSQHGVELGAWLYGTQRATHPTLRLHRIPAALETMPELMRAHGYRTFGVADNVNIAAREGFDVGFDHFASFDYAGARRVNETLEGWREELSESPRRFVYLHYMDPHEPYHRRKAFFEPPSEPGPRGEVLARYDSELRYLDRELRRGLELAGYDEQTALVLVADHGEAFYERGAVGHGFQLYSELTHVPLVMVAPGVRRANARVSANVSLVDVLPTLREWIGAGPSAQDAGQSLFPLYTGRSAPGSVRTANAEARAVFASRRHVASRGGGTKNAVVRGPLKWIETRTPGGALSGQELYDLAADPEERRNLVLSRPREVAELRAARERFFADAPRWEPEAAEPLALTPAEVERLRALGYVEEGDGGG